MEDEPTDYRPDPSPRDGDDDTFAKAVAEGIGLVREHQKKEDNQWDRDARTAAEAMLRSPRPLLDADALAKYAADFANELERVRTGRNVEQ